MVIACSKNISDRKPLSNSEQGDNHRRGVVAGGATIETTQHATAVRKHATEGINYENSSTIKRPTCRYITERRVPASPCGTCAAYVCPRKSFLRTLTGSHQSEIVDVRTCMSTTNSPPVDVRFDPSGRHLSQSTTAR